MSCVTIDGQAFEADAGKSVIELAKDHGIDIPHYCWHPRLSVVANCRMCLVEVEKAPKLLPACEVKCRDGMVVHTKSDKVLEARAAVMEFLLVNHPIDCPICDQAGECKLQNYYMEHDRSGTRFHGLKVPKKKAVPLGPTVMLDEERCINCTRCVRFMDEVAENPQLGQFDRGDRAVIGVFPGTELDDPYSGNVVDICPVGALTSRDFRFKVRSWFLRPTDSVCPGCARGCSTIVDTYKNEIQRLRGRDNASVNQGWLCDAGRMGYKSVHDKDAQILSPHIRSKDGTYVPVRWEDAKLRLIELLAPYAEGTDGTLGMTLSPQLTTEGIVAFIELAEQILHVDTYAILGKEDGLKDSLLRVADQNPNRGGAELVLESYSIFDEGPELLKRGLEQDRVKTLLMVGADHPGTDEKWGELLDRASVVVWASAWTECAQRADLVLPLTSYAEQDGTFVNCDGQMQRIRPALVPFGDRKTEMEAAAFVAAALTPERPWTLQSWISGFQALKLRTNLLDHITPNDLEPFGALLGAAGSALVAESSVVEERAVVATP